uniref:PH domain-containing protein n=1 Tax=Chromera velia CCMP2878 TaxID=1169474 RepID=A0A0G4F990_9ALVE|eukprot:Cvel_15748.t1-p1 / transcript=Cvel_15748.t1 / gene=Cvel_15748 / organism=Chromera_velia_CCMP2878 / gene_product=hypothetical protein / transcript_product=hypothetical protein / location=Cvel_scaffold1179:13761-19561(-) / protein_length=1340 / sequence_SO=supercontig / SO=protein_coding / is_pseudo=false
MYGRQSYTGQQTPYRTYQPTSAPRNRPGTVTVQVNVRSGAAGPPPTRPGWKVSTESAMRTHVRPSTPAASKHLDFHRLSPCPVVAVESAQGHSTFRHSVAGSTEKGSFRQLFDAYMALKKYKKQTTRSPPSYRSTFRASTQQRTSPPSPATRSPVTHARYRAASRVDTAGGRYSTYSPPSRRGLTGSRPPSPYSPVPWHSRLPAGEGLRGTSPVPGVSPPRTATTSPSLPADAVIDIKGQWAPQNAKGTRETANHTSNTFAPFLKEGDRHADSVTPSKYSPHGTPPPPITRPTPLWPFEPSTARGANEEPRSRPSSPPKTCHRPPELFSPSNSPRPARLSPSPREPPTAPLPSLAPPQLVSHSPPPPACMLRMKPPANDSPLPASPPKRCSPRRAERPESPRAQAALARERNASQQPPEAAPTPLQATQAETANAPRRVTPTPIFSPTMLTVSPPEAVAQPANGGKTIPQVLLQNSPKMAQAEGEENGIPSTKRTGEAPRPPSRMGSAEPVQLSRRPKGPTAETPTNQQHLSPTLSPAQAAAVAKNFGGQRISAASCAKTEEEAEGEVSPRGLLEDVSLTASAREAASRLQMASKEAAPLASTLPEPESAPLPALQSPAFKPMEEKETPSLMDHAVASFGKDEMNQTTNLLQSVRQFQGGDEPVGVDQIRIDDAEGVKLENGESPVLLGTMQVEDVPVDEAVMTREGQVGGMVGAVTAAQLQVSAPPMTLTPTDGMRTLMGLQPDAADVSSSALASDPIIQQLQAGHRVEKLDFGKKRRESVTLKLVEDRGQADLQGGCCSCGSRGRAAAAVTRQVVYDSAEESLSPGKGKRGARGKEGANAGKAGTEKSKTEEKREGGGAGLFAFLEWSREKNKKKSGVSLQEIAAALLASKKGKNGPQSPKRHQKGKKAKGKDQGAPPVSAAQEQGETPILNVECVAELVCLGKSARVRSRFPSESAGPKGKKQKEATAPEGTATLERFFYLSHPVKKRTYDFQAPDASTASLWVAGLRLVLTHLLSPALPPPLTSQAAAPGEEGGDQGGMRRSSRASGGGEGGERHLSLGRQTGDSVLPFHGSSGLPADSHSLGIIPEAAEGEGGGEGVQTGLLSQESGGARVFYQAAGGRGSRTSSLNDSGLPRVNEGPAVLGAPPQGGVGSFSGPAYPPPGGLPKSESFSAGGVPNGEGETGGQSSSPAPHAMPPLAVAFCFAPFEGWQSAFGLPGGVPQGMGPESGFMQIQDRKGAGMFPGGKFPPQVAPLMSLPLSWWPPNSAYGGDWPSSYQRQTTAESNQSTACSSGLMRTAVPPSGAQTGERGSASASASASGRERRMSLSEHTPQSRST